MSSTSTTETPPAAQFEGDKLWDPSWKESAGEATIHKRSAADKDRVPVTLYTSWFCPFAQRAWIALEETGIDYRYVEVNPYAVDPSEPGGYTKISLSLEEKRELMPEFVEASPRGLVPAIRQTDDRRVLWESLPVAEYVDAVFGNGTLVPDDPYERAQVQIWSAHCTDRINKAYYLALTAQDKEKQKQHVQQLLEECRALSRAMDKDGPYFLGNRFSMVDVALAPFWMRMLWVGKHYINLQFPQDDKDFDRLFKWWEAVSQRPAVASTFVCKKRLISSYSHYSRNIATSDFAKNTLKN